MSRPDFELAMRTLAATADTSKPLPDADLVWRHAAALARCRQYELATKSIRVAERTVGIVCALTGVLSLLALGPGIEEALRAMNPTLVAALAAAVGTTVAVASALVKALLKTC